MARGKSTERGRRETEREVGFPRWREPEALRKRREKREEGRNFRPETSHPHNQNLVFLILNVLSYFCLPVVRSCGTQVVFEIHRAEIISVNEIKRFLFQSTSTGFV